MCNVKAPVMKPFFLTAACVLILLPALAQIDTTNFEGSLVQIEIDTSNAGNIWQIGQPDKAIFDSAFSAPNAIVTDTVNYYPINDSSSFILMFELLRPLGFTMRPTRYLTEFLHFTDKTVLGDNHTLNSGVWL